MPRSAGAAFGVAAVPYRPVPAAAIQDPSALWQRLMREWQCHIDRDVAHSVQWLDHPGVSDDYHAARGVRV